MDASSSLGRSLQSKLLVTSKHSLGPVQGVPLSHAQAGEMWLKKYLNKLGKSEEDMATELWENNWTAIAEARSRFLFFWKVRI
jgi:tRNA ligase